MQAPNQYEPLDPQVNTMTQSAPVVTLSKSGYPGLSKITVKRASDMGTYAPPIPYQPPPPNRKARRQEMKSKAMRILDNGVPERMLPPGQTITLPNGISITNTYDVVKKPSNKAKNRAKAKAAHKQRMKGR